MLAASAALASTAMAAQFVMYTPADSCDAIDRMDAIVNPGEIAAHTHQVFGANRASPNMTYDSLQESTCTTVGSAAHDANGADKSVYWHPSLYAEANDGSGYIRITSGGHKLYYRDVGNDADKKADPFEFPKNFHMVAGDQQRRTPDEDLDHQKIIEWICHTSGGQIPGVDQKSGFPKDVSDCDAYPGFVGSIHFPHCWNGQEPQPTQKDHMAYPEGDVQGGRCPSTHPIRLPHIFMENFFDLHKVANKIKPDSFVLSQGDPTGYGMHADFFNGWEMGAIPRLYEDCPQPYYGNSDIGTCPAFEKMKMGVKNTDCKVDVNFEENNDTPGKYLPGCNPISKVHPAPKHEAAALGVCSNECNMLGGDDDSSYAPAAYAPVAQKHADSYQKHAPAPPSDGSSDKASKTTFTTNVVAPAPTPYHKPAKAAKPEDDTVVWVTEVITVTAKVDGPAPTHDSPAPPSYAKDRRVNHLKYHKHHHPGKN
jgi:hypothetical protein